MGVKNENYKDLQNLSNAFKAEKRSPMTFHYLFICLNLPGVNVFVYCLKCSFATYAQHKNTLSQ